MDLSQQNKLLLNRAAPSLARMVEHGLLDDEFVAALDRAMDAARNQGRTTASAAAVLSDYASPTDKITPPPHPGFHVWNPDRRMPQYRHDDLADAIVEAKRLAVQSPDERFYIMSPIACAQAKQTVLPVTFALVEPATKATFDLDELIPF